MNRRSGGRRVWACPQRSGPGPLSASLCSLRTLIVGGGPAGLAAALTASATGTRVILCDEQAELGGSLLDEPNVTIDGRPAPDWVGEAIRTVGGSVTLLPRTTAFGWYPGGMIGLLERVTDHLAAPARGCPGNAFGRSGPNASC